jgi:hypothetical protein
VFNVDRRWCTHIYRDSTLTLTLMGRQPNCGAGPHTLTHTLSNKDKQRMSYFTYVRLMLIAAHVVNPE